MTGAELIAAVRSEWPDLPVVLATGYAELPPGIDPTLPKLAKPYRQEALARLIAEHSRSRREERCCDFAHPRRPGPGPAERGSTQGCESYKIGLPPVTATVAPEI
jgi:hypothetical protein